MPKKPELTDEDQALRERIGSAIRHVSSSKGIKPQALAEAAGVSLAHQYRIESGERTPDALYLFKACRLMGITVDSLLNAAVTDPSKVSAGVTASGGSQVASGNNNVQIGPVGGKARIKNK